MSGNADRIVAEVNNGGDLVERLIRNYDFNVPYRSVRATRGKILRAEPISALYEQRRVHHVGVFSELEQQMCSYTGETNTSPDRLDALVWGLTELSKSKGQVNWRIS
jgi:phage terminase large subunit-like protein